MTWADDDQPEREFPDLDAFVDWLAHTYRRSLDTGGRVFCADWHEHAEAVSRLQGLHEAWEQLRGRPLGHAIRFDGERCRPPRPRTATCRDVSLSPASVTGQLAIVDTADADRGLQAGERDGRRTSRVVSRELFSSA
jgi:hypothetical protein